MPIINRLARGAEKALFAATDPIVVPARKLGMFDPKRIGATAIEYGLIAAGISVAIIAVVQGLGPKLKKTFSDVRHVLVEPAQSKK